MYSPNMWLRCQRLGKSTCLSPGKHAAACSRHQIRVLDIRHQNDHLSGAGWLRGFAASLCLPSGVGIANTSIPNGPIAKCGFRVDGRLIFCQDRVALGFHISAIINSSILVLAFWKLPRNSSSSPNVSWKRLVVEIDWVRAIIAITAPGDGLLRSSVSSICPLGCRSL